MERTMRELYVARHTSAISVIIGPDGTFHTRHNGRIKVDGSDPHFASASLTDLGEIEDLPGGHDILEQGDGMGHPVVIRKPDVPTEPPNGWVLPDDVQAATALSRPTMLLDAQGRAIVGTGAGCGSTIVYSPADWPATTDSPRPRSCEILLRLLEQANVNAAGRLDLASDSTAGS